jgi:hypothetical protein
MSVLDGGGQPNVTVAFSLEKEILEPLDYGDGWAPQLVWIVWKKITCPCQDLNPRSLSL